MRLWAWFVFLVTVLGLAVIVTQDATAQKRETPYYASIAASKARTRTGPARTYAATWLYVRADLPIKVVAVYLAWLKALGRGTGRANECQYGDVGGGAVRYKK